jgi:hypothetical protein
LLKVALNTITPTNYFLRERERERERETDRQTDRQRDREREREREMPPTSLTGT